MRTFCWAWFAPIPLLVFISHVQTQTSAAKPVTEAYLRYVCAADGNVPAKAFGEWPLFHPPLRLVLEGGPSGPLPIESNLIPLSSGGYKAVSLLPGKIVIQESTTGPADKTPPKTLTFLNFQPKPGCYYTLLICGKGKEIKLDLIEDEVALLPPMKDGEEPPPPRRSLRCLVLEQGLRVRISCPGSGVKLEAGSDKPVLAENLRPGLWNLDIEGEIKGQSFSTKIELDLGSPGNWTLFFMRDIYGRIATTLKKDASLD